MSSTNGPIMLIPRVFPNISEKRIRGVIGALRIGYIEKVDIINTKGKEGKQFNKVFIHMKSWNETEEAQMAKKRLEEGKEIKIVYDDPWFWKVVAYKSQKPKRAYRPKPTLHMEDNSASEKEEGEILDPSTPTSPPPREETEEVGVKVDYGPYEKGMPKRRGKKATILKRFKGEIAPGLNEEELSPTSLSLIHPDKTPP